ncbi:hypothetical protein BDZ89DRAFT_1138897 [Hymenopellis radicata]|nr:hypothetical protein BDZ89DRAFT_1138897 [Hymenopellis radicata]
MRGGFATASTGILNQGRRHRCHGNGVLKLRRLGMSSSDRLLGLGKWIPPDLGSTGLREAASPPRKLKRSRHEERIPRLMTERNRHYYSVYWPRRAGFFLQKRLIVTL